MTTQSLGFEIDALAARILERAVADPEKSYTAQLLASGVPGAARKFGEEAAETMVAALATPATLPDEAADVLYHLLVLLAASGVSTADVAARLSARAARSGLAEKAARKSPHD
jgi:phosphoribosyl-ATP pyrophosphohydrolase